MKNTEAGGVYRKQASRDSLFFLPHEVIFCSVFWNCLSYLAALAIVGAVVAGGAVYTRL
jgi:hypothetical protein